jgi:hypothetical protein
VSGTEDRLVVFPADDRMLLMARGADGDEHFVLIDTAARAVLAKRVVPAWYWSPRSAPSGRALVVNNIEGVGSLHVLDTATLQYRELAYGGARIDAMWNHDRDVLTAISVVDPFTDHPHARLLQWDFEGVDLSGPLPEPTVQWELDGYDWDSSFSFTWIGISPDDRWAVFPVIKKITGESVLLVLDQDSGEVRLTPGRGPVGFLHDSSAIVSYGHASDGTPGDDLWLIDPVTLARTTARLPTDSEVSFFPTHESPHVGVTPVLDVHEQPLLIYNTSTGAMVPSSRIGIDLHDFVSRPGHLYVESSRVVFDLAVETGVMREVALGEPVHHISATPGTDRAYAAAVETATIYPIDTVNAVQSGAAFHIPSPFGGVFGGDKLLDTVARRTRTPLPRTRHQGNAISLDP